jgi:hypothetical protein
VGELLGEVVLEDQRLLAREPQAMHVDDVRDGRLLRVRRSPPG